MNRRLHSRVHRANGSYPRGSDFEWDLQRGSSGAYIVHFPRSSITRFVRAYGGVIRVLPCSCNEGSSTRVLAVFGIKFSRASEGSPQRQSCCVWAVSRSSHFRQNPPRSIWSTESPTFLVVVGRAICGVPKRAPGGSAVLREWWLADALSWGVAQSSTFWESDAVSLDASEGGDVPYARRRLSRSHLFFDLRDSLLRGSAIPLLSN